MSENACRRLNPLVTPYVDGELSETERQQVDRHLRACPPCHSRVAAERAVHELIRGQRDALSAPCASSALHARCSGYAKRPDGAPAGAAASVWRARLTPLAAAASLVLIVGVAFLYQLTAASSRVMAAELAADHLKCFAVSGITNMHEEPSTVESAMWSGFGWRMHLPEHARDAGLELVGSSQCMYGEGRVAHILYRHNGEPLSVFMLPRATRAQELVQVLGHKAAIWCDGERTFVLVAREPREEVERMAALVQRSLK
jgi:anti-sigma factor RsiW